LLLLVNEDSIPLDLEICATINFNFQVPVAVAKYL